MVNELKELMRENVAAPPPDHLDLEALIGAGRRRVRGRRTAFVGAAALVRRRGRRGHCHRAGRDGPTRPATADRPPAPDAPTI